MRGHDQEHSGRSLLIGPQNGRAIWTFATKGPITGSPAIGADGTIYIGSWDQNLYAVTTEGTEKWSAATGGVVSSTPAIRKDGSIIVGSHDGKVYAFGSDGSVLWILATGGRVSSSPVIGLDGTIYIGSEDGKLYSVSSEGELKWTFQTGSWILASPALSDDGTVYVGSNDHKFYAVSKEGEEKWSVETGGLVYSSAAIADDGTIYVGSYYNEFYSISPTGSIRWKLMLGGVVTSSPAIGTDGTIYVGCWDRRVYAISKDGEVVWKKEVAKRYIYSSPAIADDGKIYIGSFDHFFYIIIPARGYDLVSRNNQPCLCFASHRKRGTRLCGQLRREALCLWRWVGQDFGRKSAKSCLTVIQINYSILESERCAIHSQHCEIPPYNQTVIFAKSADCEVNEANPVVRIPRQRHTPGEVVRLTHLTVPQAPETCEIILTKAFWTYGCEMGVNEFGLAMGEEAVYTLKDKIETRDGVIGPDLMRIGLERAKTCVEAIDIMTVMLEQYGQGGNGEMSGNSHFDSNFLMADASEAYILETAGRDWVVKKIEAIGSISNMLHTRSDWDRYSGGDLGSKVDWARTYGRPEVPPKLGSPDRQAVTYQGLAENQGEITVKTAFDILRHHGQGYNPATADVHHNICIHAGPQENRWWQADGAMVTEVDERGVMAWLTGTSGTCLSIFKPVFLGVELPDIGPMPTQNFDPNALWWKHELLHRRAMADFKNLMPEIRKDFDRIEADFLAAAHSVKNGSGKEKKEFSDYCFRKAIQATEIWIERLRGRHDLLFEDPAYGAMWTRMNTEAGLSGMPM